MLTYLFFCFCNALQWLLLNKLGGTSVVAMGGAGVCQELAGGAKQVFVLGMRGLWERSTAVPSFLHIHQLGDFCAHKQGICVSHLILDLIELLKAAGL